MYRLVRNGVELFQVTVREGSLLWWAQETGEGQHLYKDSCNPLMCVEDVAVSRCIQIVRAVS